MRSPSLLAIQSMAILAVVGITACQEPPSVRLRWAIEGKEAINAVACSESGLLQVRARAYDGSGAANDGFVGERFFPCFPSELEDPDGMVDGPILPPGEYALELRGVDRMGNPWDDEEDPSFGDADGTETPSCRPGSDTCRDHELVCDCMPLRVVEGGDPVDLPELVLVAPPECIDGIDNDHDGLVDGNDPACTVAFGDGTEGIPVGITELELNVTLLGGSLETCTSNLGRLRLTVDTGEGPQVLIDDACRLDRPYRTSVQLPPGPATFSVVAFDPCPEQLCRDNPYCMGTQPACYPPECAYFHAVCDSYHLTREQCSSDSENGGFDPAPPAECFEPVSEVVTVVKESTAEISPIGGTVSIAVDFGASDFLEPIVSEIRAKPGFVSELGNEAKVRYSCQPPVITEGVTRGLLQLDQLRVELLNGHGGSLDTPVALEDGTVLDGLTTIDCRTDLVTEELEWGSYALAIEALSPEGEVCFSNVASPFLPSPESIGTMLIPRAYQEDGTVRATCHDCETDADCGLDTLRCVDNMCQSSCEDDGDCKSPQLGDLGFVCTEQGYCGRGSGA